MSSAYQSNQAFFGYSGKEPYIKLTEKSPEDVRLIQRCFLLDQQLSIIQRQKEKDIDLEFLSRENEEQAVKIHYLIEEHPQKYFFQKMYQKYYQLSDFLIGREHWGRIENTLKMESDLVSRDHTRLAFNNKNQSKERSFQILKNNIKSETRRSSKWRKLPSDLLEKIIEYSLQRPYYSLQDCGSRNGTYLLDYHQTQNLIKLGQSFQFQHQSYVIEIHHIKRITGVQLDSFLQEQELRYQMDMRLNCTRAIVLPDNISREQLKQSTQKFYFISLEFYVSHQFKFLYSVVNKNERIKYPIGEGQLLNVSNTGDSINITKHGYLSFQQGLWYILPEKEIDRVWTKLLPKKEYILDKERYKIMIAHYSVLEVEFNNFK